ncbi:MAG: hypothetical protein P8Y10_14465 [Gemmatimonadales bacterium]
MRNGEGSSGLLEASYDGVKLELEQVESDIEKLQVRAEKLRAAAAALKDLVSERSQTPTNGAAVGDVWFKQDEAVSRQADGGYQGTP